MGASAGAMPKKMVICAIIPCACAGGKMSRTMARDTTMPAPVDKPCSVRNTTSCVMFCDSAQPADASVNITSPQRITGLRPKLSASAP